jgi:DnaJ-domain-containing protein 1
MFLNSLNPTEKDNFMKLAVAVIKADGVVEESEKQILSAYANEMQIPVCNLDEQSNADNIIKEFAVNSTLQTKRIVFLELLALAFADGNYAAEEKALVQQIASVFEFDKAFIEQAINLEDAYMAAYMSLVNLVEKGE